MSDKIGEISCAYSLRNQEGILSGLQALLVFSEVSSLATPVTVITRGLMLGFGSFPTLGGSKSDSSVKTEENCLFKISALISLSLNILPSYSRSATPWSSFFSCFIKTRSVLDFLR